jgi:hypothetical protein
VVGVNGMRIEGEDAGADTDEDTRGWREGKGPFIYTELRVWSFSITLGMLFLVVNEDPLHNY